MIIIVIISLLRFHHPPLGASLPDADFDGKKELEGQLFRLGMKFDEVHELVDSNLKQQPTRRQPFQTGRLADDQARQEQEDEEEEQVGPQGSIPEFPGSFTVLGPWELIFQEKDF